MGMGYFRPDLNFDGASEGEVEVRQPPNTVDIYQKSLGVKVYEFNLIWLI